jgi:CBS domain containing-hemolysin-like protein
MPWDVVILVTAVCVLGSGFFSGCETGFMSTSRARLHHRQRSRPEARAGKLRHLLDRIEDPVLTCLIGTNLFVVLTSAVMTTALTARFGARGELLATFIVSVNLILFGEILPKVLYREFPERLTLASIPVIQTFMVILAPIRWLLRFYSDLWRRLLPEPFEEAGSRLDRQGMATLLLAHSLPGDQDRPFRRSLRRFLVVAKSDLRQIMRPFDQVITVPSSAKVGQCLEVAAQAGLSRLPVVGQEGDHVTGWVLVRDLLFLPSSLRLTEAIPARLLRSAVLVDADMSPYELFEEFHSQNQQLAVVVDRNGKFQGIVTLEDLIERVVGPVWEEFETSPEVAS